MSDHPFHVAGGFFAPPRHSPPEALTQQRPSLPEEASSAPRPSSRRRKLWDIPHKFHCPVIGVCFGVDELRGLMARSMQFPRDTSDFVLHTSAVGACETRTPLAEALHKQLEKRFQLSVRSFTKAKDAEALGKLWRDAVQTGIDLPAALWASWTHPACDVLLEQDIYADIHMIQHQLGTGTRAELSTLKALQADNTQLRRQLDAARHEVETQRAEKSRETQQLGQRVAELRIELACKDAYAANLTGQLDLLRQSLPDLKERQALARRASDAEARASALTAQAGEQGREIDYLRDRLRALTQHAGETIKFLQADGPDAAPEDAEANLAGKCVLCVGGRTGSIDGYRQIVEQRGGRFLHHDGGLEESLHRIDGFLAAADLVICQAGCISHNAYWRVKEQCKRTGKPCLYMKNGGASGLSRLIDQSRSETALPAKV
ncbi:MAG: DUF2325 domain-containing protein [Ferribacterium limneticum]